MRNLLVTIQPSRAGQGQRVARRLFATIQPNQRKLGAGWGQKIKRKLFATIQPNYGATVSKAGPSPYRGAAVRHILLQPVLAPTGAVIWRGQGGWVHRALARPMPFLELSPPRDRAMSALPITPWGGPVRASEAIRAHRLSSAYAAAVSSALCGRCGGHQVKVLSGPRQSSIEHAAAGTKKSASGNQRIHAHRLHSVCAASDTQVRVVACQAPGDLASNTLRQALRSQPLAIGGFVLIICTLCADSCSSAALGATPPATRIKPRQGAQLRESQIPL